MARIDWNRSLIVLLCLIALLVLLVAVWLMLAAIAEPLLLFVFGIVLAFLLAPLVGLGQRLGLPRWLTVLLIYAGFVVVFVIGLGLLVVPLASQVSLLLQNLPGYAASLDNQIRTLDQNLIGTPLEGSVATVKAEVTGSLAAWSTAVLSGLLGFLTGLGNGTANGVMVVIISIYMLLGGQKIAGSVRGALPPRYQPVFDQFSESLTRILGGYLRGQLILALLLGVVVTIGLQLMGVPYSLLLGVLATLLELIPMFGSALSAVPALLVALTLPLPTVLWVLVFFIVVQNVQDQVIAPRISGQAVGLHPLAVIFALLVGFHLAGGVGALFALPVAGLIWSVATTTYRALVARPQPALVVAGTDPDGPAEGASSAS